MSNVDPISNMLTIIRNAYAVQKESVSIDQSKIKLAILSILKANSYIESFEAKEGKINVTLKYEEGGPVIRKIDRVSRPGRRVYMKSEEIPAVLSGQGIAVVSTSKGVMTGEDAKKARLGGELICKVY